MRSTVKILIAVLFLTPLFWSGSAFGYETDDSVPDITARVARISLLDGEAKVRHSDSEDWELAAQNLPIVEGDEIATEGGARLEIQIDSYSYFRLTEDSRLKIENLKDAGVVLSLSQGTMSLRLSQFDKDKSYFEIDAPRTTVAIQKAGKYRIDAGFANSAETGIAVTENGEARIYSDDAAFTLRSGRSAKIQLNGDFAGDWEMADASAGTDEFDGWSADRDRDIAERLKDAYYDQYYDRDIYGAEDLAGYGDWIHTTQYGYVWRPYQNAISRYADWSPYRYGQWRWIPPFGWTWVNDEPWGWATYHHGRWFYDNGYWAWAPYGYYRPSRSWWLPALVAITVVNNNVCWYPLPYDSNYYDYNRHYHSRNHGRDRDKERWDNDRRRPGQPAPSPSQVPPTRNPNDGGNARSRRLHTPPLMRVPQNGVVTVASGDFGRGGRRFTTPPISIANTVLAKAPSDATQVPELPSVETVRTRMSPGIKTEKPQNTQPERVRTGAAERRTGAPMDEELRKNRILVSRPPIRTEGQPGETRQVEQDTRDTGVTRRRETRPERVPPTPASGADTPQPETPKYSPRQRQDNRRVELPPRKPEDTTVEAPKQKPEEPKVETPKREQPVFRPRPKQEENPERDERRNNPTPREDRRAEPPRQETPK
jgi:Periplasmic protein TonB, links inner and outer membranes